MIRKIFSKDMVGVFFPTFVQHEREAYVLLHFFWFCFVLLLIYVLLLFLLFDAIIFNPHKEMNFHCSKDGLIILIYQIIIVVSSEASLASG